MGSPTGNLQVGGLPFPAINVTTGSSGGQLSVGRASTFAGDVPISGDVQDNGSHVNLRKQSTAGGNYTNSVASDLGNTTNDNDLSGTIMYRSAS